MSQVKPLTFRQIYNNFFLVNDFMQELSRVKAPTSDFFDLQYEIHGRMKGATAFGGKYGQFTMFAMLAAYFIKGRSVPLRFVYGFLYVYWVNHFYTLGSYAGALLKLPGTGKSYVDVTKRADRYYAQHPYELNRMQQLRQLIARQPKGESVEKMLEEVFDSRKVVETRSYVSNEYFAKNFDKYFTDDKNDTFKTQVLTKQPLALPILDTFLTRYIYHHMRRWLVRVGQWAGRVEE